MIKRFLSFVALSVTLISPVFADDFVPLQYYEEEPVHYIPQTRMVIPNGVMSIDKNFEIGKLYDNNNKKNDKKTNEKVDWNSKKEENKDIDWCGIRDDLVRDNTHSLEEVINNHHFSDTFKSGALEDILWEMRIGNTSNAFEIFDENFPFCASWLPDEPDDKYLVACTDTYCSKVPRNPELLRELEGEVAKNTGKNIGKVAKDAKKLSNSKAEDLAKKKGFKNAHDLKKQNLKGQRDTTMSHYNMYYNSKTKELFLKHESTGKFIKVD